MLGSFLGILTVGIIYLVFEIVQASLRKWLIETKEFLRAIGIEIKLGGKHAKKKD